MRSAVGLASLGTTVAISAAIAQAPDVAAARPTGGSASPIYGVSIPPGYRSWELIAPALEDASLDELRVVLGNRSAVDAFRRGVRPFPDGAVLVKLAWKRERSRDFATATVPGEPTTVQIMVKDAKRYPDSGGWGFGRFVGMRPADEEQHRTCFSCHDSKVRDRDWVFTRFTP